MILALQETAGGGADSLLVWLGVLATVLLAFCAAGIWLGLGKLRELDASAKRLSVLDDLKRQLAGLSEERGDIDLRRLQHLLIDIRDGLRGIEDAVLGAVTVQRTTESVAEIPPAPQLAERVTNRLLALGYEQIELANDAEVLAEIANAQEGEVRVEAKRGGAVYKGVVRVAAGRIQTVDMSPCFSLFP